MAEPVQITFLGGLGDIGRNCAAIESQGEVLLLDCGVLFPDEDMPGADFVLPDLEYLRDRADRIVGCICTHGHEDHIGALPRALEWLSFPVYASPFTLGLIRNRLEERDVSDRTTLVPIGDHDRVRIGSFDCEFIPVTHSVPSGLISAIRTSQGVVLHSSDFKLDLNPVDGRRTDLARIGAIARGEGIRLLLCDSTNSEIPGSSRSETEIGEVLRGVFAAHPDRRMVVAAFSSHIHRIQQVADAAVESGRKVATLGLSMKRNFALARELGLLRLPDHAVIDVSDADHYRPGEVCVVSTGSQGESRSALAMAATGDSRWIKIGPDDTVVLSSSPITRKRGSSLPHDQQPGVPGGESGPQRPTGGSHHRPWQAGRASHPPHRGRPRVLRAGTRRGPPFGGPRRAGHEDGHAFRSGDPGPRRRAGGG